MASTHTTRFTNTNKIDIVKTICEYFSTTKKKTETEQEVYDSLQHNFVFYVIQDKTIKSEIINKDVIFKTNDGIFFKQYEKPGKSDKWAEIVEIQYNEKYANKFISDMKKAIMRTSKIERDVLKILGMHFQKQYKLGLWKLYTPHLLRFC